MSDELRRLAKYLRQPPAEAQPYTDSDGLRLFVSKAMELADAVLDAHPADDAEPVTVEWLRSIGFVTAMNPKWVKVTAPNGRLSLAHSPVWGWQLLDVTEDYDSVRLDPPATRGAVRRLLTALGITTTPETTP